MVVIVCGSSTYVFFVNGGSPEMGWLQAHCQWCWTPLAYLNVKVVPWLNWRDRCGYFDAVCVSSEPVWCAFVYTVFCFEKKCGGSCKNTRLYVSSSPPPTAGSPCGLGFFCTRRGQSFQSVWSVFSANLALQHVHAGGVFEIRVSICKAFSLWAGVVSSGVTKLQIHFWDVLLHC